MLRTASIKLRPTSEQANALATLRSAYADACNALVPLAIEHRCWNRVALHKLGYYRLRQESPLGSQMCCNAIYSVCKAYKAQKELGHIKRSEPVPEIRFRSASVHFDKRTYRLKANSVSLYTLSGRMKVQICPGSYQQRMLDCGQAKEAELIYREGTWYFNLVIESEDPAPIVSGPILGIDVGENNLAATSTGKVWGGGLLRDKRDRHLALRRRLQFNGSQSAKQLLCKVSGKEQRRVTHTNHIVSKAIVREATKAGATKIVMEELTNIRERIDAGLRVRTRLHRWAFRQLQSFVDYKARAAGVEVQYINPAYTSRTCSGCGALGKRRGSLFKCEICGLRAHADCNASRNHARIGASTLASRAAVNRPHVGNFVVNSHEMAP